MKQVSLALVAIVLLSLLGASPAGAATPDDRCSAQEFPVQVSSFTIKANGHPIGTAAVRTRPAGPLVDVCVEIIPGARAFKGRTRAHVTAWLKVKSSTGYCTYASPGTVSKGNALSVMQWDLQAGSSVTAGMRVKVGKKVVSQGHRVRV